MLSSMIVPISESIDFQKIFRTSAYIFSRCFDMESVEL